jgi:hypothetical protein
MNSAFYYSTKFVLTREYYTECFEQSVVIERSFRRYAKAIFFIVFGAGLVIFTEANPYAAWFVFALGILEALALRYQKSWWVTRQMFSREAKSQVELIMDEQHISTHSVYQQNKLTWQQISSITATEKGWLLLHSAGKNYLSNQFLSEQAQQYLSAKIVEKQQTCAD